MARPKRFRKMLNPPLFKGFKPYGGYGDNDDPVVLLLEELEAIRLLDYEGMSQVEAAEMMGVSRPTLTRIYDVARRKVASAFTEARSIIIEGGKVIFDDQWFRCLHCHSTFNNPASDKRILNCPVCGGIKIEHLAGNLS